ncbi:sigma-70 family RNA polymerase sigma factor [Streptomyces clavuligerus]|uniref:RNA polymerase sigma factor n=1 Tax=Streptomyces clavuligerus TaxID=1901 RepID=B1PR38_STRCL|nr:sigma-70 family RNA polymerase sigma factor [Streptomyces clavuligerus]ACA51688.1 putative RNA polymerase sigma factor [Streptomyces clavuligerus]ACB72853.1 putative RNA polymerase sigma factor [Streptomyces clavuligerus]ANW18153.1 RNA polymerase subunit sigma [Streptomyces clavuligerus]AXU12714.1 sigma-70 family RNA polymerase sigma factor [Streptomyces clavuligerus]EDY47141.1 RNA polymerase sigma factor SigL [Streptomyces clavuligerus]
MIALRERTPDTAGAAALDRPHGCGHPVRAESCHETLREVHAIYGKMLLSLVLRFTGGDRHWAEDVVQETFLRAWRHVHQLRQEGETRNLLPWLATVARRIVINDRRRRACRPKEVEVTEGDPGFFTVPDGTSQILSRIVVLDAMAKLTSAHRRVITEVYLYRRTINEVALSTGVPPGTVKSRLHYGLRIMRAELEKRGVTA